MPATAWRTRRAASCRSCSSARAGDKTISFTGVGREHAEQIVRRHRLIERFLTDVLGIPWDEVHEEAERLEHAMSPVLEERMLAAIGDVETGASVRVLRFENEAEDLLHYLKEAGIEPGMAGTVASADADEVVV